MAAKRVTETARPRESWTLTVDGREVTVPEGSTLLDAARAAGVEIPTLCDHPHLKPYGSCRLCVVEVEGSDRLFASCVTPAAAGMKVRSDTERVRQARQTVLELILTYHPLDCPVCPQSGRCLLQDMVFKHGLAAGRFGTVPAGKRVASSSPLIEMNQDRCILCGRCVRICDEVEGEGNLSFTGRGAPTAVEPAFRREWDCEFCGQCFQACPVGSLYSKVYKHTAPLWELTPVRTTCPFCGVGCTLTLEVRGDRIHHVVGEASPGAVNQGLLCSKGRFGYQAVGSPERLTRPLVRRGGELLPATWEEALAAAAEGIGRAVARGGPGAVGGIASPRASNEDTYVFQKLLRATVGTPHLDSASRWGLLPALLSLRSAFGLAAGTAVLEDLSRTELVFAAGANLTEDSHVAGLLAMRRTRSGKARLVAAHDRRVKLFRFADLALSIRPGALAPLLWAMCAAVLEEGREDREFVERRVADLGALRQALGGFSPESLEAELGVPGALVREAAREVAEAPSAVIVLAPGAGSPGLGSEAASAAATLALLTGQVGREGAGVLVLPEFANSQGSLDMGACPEFLPGWQAAGDEAVRRHFGARWGAHPPAGPGLTAPRMMEEAAAGHLSALLVMGEDPLHAFPGREAVERALHRLDCLVVSDQYLTATARLASVVFPAAAGCEKEGSFTSGERRVQALRRAVAPPGGAQEDWRVWAALSAALGRDYAYRGSAEVTGEIAATVPAYAGITPRRLEEGGVHWPCPDPELPGEANLYRYRFFAGAGKPGKPRTRPVPGARPAGYPLELVTGTVRHHSGTITTHARGLMQVSPGLQLHLHPEDAARLGIAAGDRLRLSTAGGKVEALAKLTGKVRPGTVFLPVHFPALAWNTLVGPEELAEGRPVPCAVEKEERHDQ